MSIDDDYAAYIPLLRDQLRSIGVTFEANNLANATAVGITQLVWRTGPIEHTHAGARGRRNGLHDGVMFARNTWVYHQALQAVTSSDPYALLRFEDRILDRGLVWPGTSGTLSQFGYGALGEIRKYAKKRVNFLPAWEPRVRSAVERLRGEDSSFIERLKTVYNKDFSTFLDTAPPIVREDLHQVEHALLNAPYDLGAETLSWFAGKPVL